MKARGERSRTMIIIGCDYHPGFQQIAFVDTETGDYGEQRLEHSEGAEEFYRDLDAQGQKGRVGMEEMAGGTALADASWSGCTDGLSLRINHRKDGAISVREADRGVFRVSAPGGLKRKSATTGPYYEAREFDVALLAGGSGPSYSAQHSGMAQ